MGHRLARESLSRLCNQRLGSADDEKVGAMRTIEKGIKVVIEDLAQFEEILGSFGTCLDLEVDDYVSEGCFQEEGHGRFTPTAAAVTAGPTATKN